MTVSDIKTLVPIEEVLRHYGHSPTAKGVFHCPFPDNHHHGDANPSGSLAKGRAYCHSQGCLGEKGSDIFALVGLLENLPAFPDQKRKVIEVFLAGSSHGNSSTPQPCQILRAFHWEDAQGRVAYHLRVTNPSKFKWNQKSDGSGPWTLKPCHPDLYQRDAVLLASKVILCAGERDCDIINDWVNALGQYPDLAATCTHTGENAVNPAALELIHGKARVYVLGDNDLTGATYRDKVRHLLQGNVGVLYPLYCPAEYNDIADWQDAGGTAEQFKALLDQAQPVSRDQPKQASAQTNEQHGRDQLPTQASQLVALVEATNCQLFHDEEQRPYASIPIEDHWETWPLRRKSFKQWLTRQFYLQYDKAPGSQAVQDALTVLEGKALFEGKQEPLFVRIGGNEQDVFIDLGDAHWNMVHLTAEGWAVVPHGTIHFKRGAGMKALPHPIPGGHLETLLTPFVNADAPENLILLIGWLVAGLRPTGSQLVLELHGEQGSGKSTLLEVLKAIMDPNKAAKRSEPREPRDLMIAASSNWLLSLDNLSGIPGWLSDALCRLSTGGAFGTRQLYTDDEETLFEAKRPVVLNGIGSVVTRPDLLDRSILLSLPCMPTGTRKPEREFWQDFHAASGQILGALCDAVVSALQQIATTHLTDLERMADAVVWVTAAESALGWEPGTFQKAYRSNRAMGNETALEASLLYEPLSQFLQQPELENHWEGTMGNLLTELNAMIGEAKAKQKAWPSNPRALRSALQRIVPNLRAIGLQVEFGSGRTNKGSVVHLDFKGEPPSRPSPQSPDVLVSDGREGRDGRSPLVSQAPSSLLPAGGFLEAATEAPVDPWS